MKTERIHRAAALRGRHGLIVFVGAFALLSALLASCGARTGSSVARSPSSPSAASPSVTPTQTTSPTPSVTPASWRRIAASPIHRYYYTPAAAVWDGNEMLIVATQGGNVGDCKEVVLAYDPSTDSWRVMSGVPAPKGCFEGSDKPVWTGHELLLWGISNAAYNPATDTWRHLPVPPAGAGGPSVVVWTGEQMIGWGGGCCDQELADGAAYTLATNSWKMLPPSPLVGRHATGVWMGTELIIAGGSGYNPPPTQRNWDFVHFSDAAAYDPATRTWRKLPSMPVARGGDYASVWDGREMIVIGGTSRPSASAEPLARGVAYNPATNTWRWLAPMEFLRSGFACAWTGSQLVVWGGTSDGGTIPPNGEAYDAAADTWSALPKAPLRARTDAAAVWTGTELIVWGGVDARPATPEGSWKELFDGAAFKPASA
jgi:Kelch motif